MDTETEARHVTDRLTARHPSIPDDVVRAMVAETFARYADARVHAFVPILVQRSVEERLRGRDGAVPAPRAATESG